MQSQTHPAQPAQPQVPPGTPTLTPPAPLDVQSLIGQLAEAQIRRNSLLYQLSGGATGIERAQLRAQVANVDREISLLRGQLQDATQSYRGQGTFPGGTTPPPPFPRIPRGPQMSDNVTAVWLVFLLAVVMPISIGFTRRMWRRTPKGSDLPISDPMIAPRLERLEQAIDAVAIEVERISESQRFIAKVLAERPAQMPAGGEAAPRALGAGPIEQVRVGERDKLRQVITPH